jgi:hypothetical protein
MERALCFLALVYGGFVRELPAQSVCVAGNGTATITTHPYPTGGISVMTVYPRGALTSKTIKVGAALPYMVVTGTPGPILWGKGAGTISMSGVPIGWGLLLKNWSMGTAQSAPCYLVQGANTLGVETLAYANYDLAAKHP